MSMDANYDFEKAIIPMASNDSKYKTLYFDARGRVLGTNDEKHFEEINVPVIVFNWIKAHMEIPEKQPLKLGVDENEEEIREDERQKTLKAVIEHLNFCSWFNVAKNIQKRFFPTDPVEELAKELNGHAKEIGGINLPDIYREIAKHILKKYEPKKKADE